MTAVADLIRTWPVSDGEERDTLVERRLRMCREVSDGMRSQAKTPFARDLYWQCSDVATTYLFGIADQAAREDALQFCRRAIGLAVVADRLARNEQ